MTMTRNDKASWLRAVWLGLEQSGVDDSSEQWNDICTAMAWIAEELEVEQDEI